MAKRKATRGKAAKADRIAGTAKDKRKRHIKRTSPALVRALRVNRAVRENGKLPKPRVEVRKNGKGYQYRTIDKYGRKDQWSEPYTLRNNCRRAMLKSGLPIVSVDAVKPGKSEPTRQEEAGA